MFFLIDLSFFVENQILNKLDTVLSSQHLSSSIVVETKSVGLATAEESVQEPTTRPEWRPKSLKVGYGLLLKCCYKITVREFLTALAYGISRTPE